MILKVKRRKIFNSMKMFNGLKMAKCSSYFGIVVAVILFLSFYNVSYPSGIKYRSVGIDTVVVPLSAKQITFSSTEKPTFRENNQVRVVNETTELQEEKGPPLVLILTYLRSGSTLTADIIERGQNVFYVYEPLRFYMDKKFAYFDKDGLCFENNTCRKPTDELGRTFTILEDIHNFFMCGLYYVHPRFFWNADASVSVAAMKRCFVKENVGCMYAARNVCNKSARSIKTIRLSMRLAEILMENIPNLKIVHLMRDPRGMLQSRKRGGFLPRGKLNAEAKAVCLRMLRDIDVGRRLRKVYFGRIKTILYDQIADFPKQASYSLFNFLDLKPSINFDEWLHNHTSAGQRSGFYETTRANSSETASTWRRKWSYDEVKIIDAQCQKLYKILGLKEATETNLKNLNIKLRTLSPEFGDFL